MQCRTVCSTAGTLRSSAKVTSRRFAYHQDRVWVTFTHFSELKSGPRRPASQHRHLIARASRCRCCGRRRSGEAVAPDPLFRPGSRGAGEDGADDEVRVGGVQGAAGQEQPVEERAEDHLEDAVHVEVAW
jgi:hypothetical protein